MSRESFIAALENAADNVEDMPRHELAILLRRAALRLRNVSEPWDEIEREYERLIEDINRQ